MVSPAPATSFTRKMLSFAARYAIGVVRSMYLVWRWPPTASLLAAQNFTKTAAAARAKSNFLSEIGITIMSRACKAWK